MNALQATERALLAARVRALIDGGAGDGAGADSALAEQRDALLAALADYQRRWVAPYARFCAQRSAAPAGWAPALPTDAFRFARISSRAPEQDVRRFRSSGSTHAEQSTHAFADLSLYDAAAQTAARRMLFPDRPRMQLLILAPPEQTAGDSSLSYMLARFVEWFGAPGSRHMWPLDAAELAHALQATEQPVALLGTSFAFVHALDALGARRFRLPAASRIMQTGGFKGRSRTLEPAAMRDWLSERFGLEPGFIVAEYGMTELSSQLYETTLREAALGLPATPRRLWAPPWLRVSVLAPERQLPLASGEPGLLRMDDPANLDSVSALQTADVGSASGDGFVLHGRAEGAIARGCSISADELLEAQRSGP